MSVLPAAPVRRLRASRLDLTDEEHSQIRVAAALEDRSVAVFVRRAAVEHARRVLASHGIEATTAASSDQPPAD
jgi:uncharacterized protein (DUF1778 family)